MEYKNSDKRAMRDGLKQIIAIAAENNELLTRLKQALLKDDIKEIKHYARELCELSEDDVPPIEKVGLEDLEIIGPGMVEVSKNLTMDDIKDEYLTVKELAAVLKIHPGSVRNRMKDGIYRLGVEYVKDGRNVRLLWSAIKDKLHVTTPKPSQKTKPGHGSIKVKKSPRSKTKINSNKKGSVTVRGKRLWVDFSYMGERVREPTGLLNTEENKVLLRRMLDKIHIEIEEGSFEFQKRLPHSKKVAHFTLLEGGTHQRRPETITFGQYWESWYAAMKPGMSLNKIKDYESALNYRILPFFGKLTFAVITPMTMKKFMAHLQGVTTRFGTPLSSASIRNIFIPLRVIVNDAISEYGFDIPDPFSTVVIPSKTRAHVNPFTLDEWKRLIDALPERLRPYFEFAAATGLRPSEQVALKKSAISDIHIEVELTRVRAHEKSELKTASSKRIIEMRPRIKQILERQVLLSSNPASEYVFSGKGGEPIEQNNLWYHWCQAEKRAGLPHRRMYETRHTFASWALAAGEQPSWIARTLGHANLNMVYTVYGRFIPGFNGSDGGKLEDVYKKNLE